MSTNRAFLLFFVFVLSVTRSNGQFEMHPLLQSRDSVRAYRIRTIEIRSEAVNRKSQEYTYDRRGRLVRIIQYGSAGEPILEQRYAYRGRRATLHQTYVWGRQRSGPPTRSATMRGAGSWRKVHATGLGKKWLRCTNTVPTGCP